MLVLPAMIQLDAKVCNRTVVGRFWHVCYALIVLVSLTCQNADSDKCYPTLPTYIMIWRDVNTMFTYEGGISFFENLY